MYWPCSDPQYCNSPTNSYVDNSKYFPVKDLQQMSVDQKDEETPEPFPAINYTCKYSAFSSLRMSEDKGI